MDANGPRRVERGKPSLVARIKGLLGNLDDRSADVALVGAFTHPLLKERLQDMKNSIHVRITGFDENANIQYEIDNYNADLLGLEDLTARELEVIKERLLEEI
ncbi:MAG: hypothetical protein ACFFCS_29030 [Candidatus Hodarchaeota archaeon]